MKIEFATDRYAIAVYRGPAMVGFVPGMYRVVKPVVDPRDARKLSLVSDARLVAEGLSPSWKVAGYRLRAWDLRERSPLDGMEESMTCDARNSREPRYALAIYDGSRHVGFLPRQGSSPVREDAGVDLDLFYSELGVRSQARLRAFGFAPLTVAPYDLNEHRPLDPIPVTEDNIMPLRDEETREPMPDPVVRAEVAADGGNGSGCECGAASVVDIGGAGLDVVPGSYRAYQKESFDAKMLADLRRSNVRDGLSPVVLVLAEAQRELVRLVTRLMPDGDG